MFNYKLAIEYDGTDLFGWQKQKNTDRTVQHILESSLKQLLGTEIKLTGAGRTDAGVHAVEQAANFYCEEKLITDKFVYSLNSILPENITVKSAEEAALDFHARYSAKKREYEYYFTTSKKSLYNAYFTYIKYKPETRKIEKALKIFEGEKSFRSLCKNKTDKHNFYCNVYKVRFTRLAENDFKFNISANRFLHSMVRAITGCLIDIGRGKLDADEVKDKIKKGEKIKTTYLPAKGLFLKKIYY